MEKETSKNIKLQLENHNIGRTRITFLQDDSEGIFSESMLLQNVCVNYVQVDITGL